MRLTLNQLPPEITDRIAGVVLFGDPTADSAEPLIQRFAGPSRHLLGWARQKFIRRLAPPESYTRFPTKLGERVYNFCVVKDPVCAVPANETLTPAEVFKALKAGLTRHRFYPSHNMDYGAGHWLAGRFDDRSLAPSFSISGDEDLRVGKQARIAFEGKGPRPPVTVTLENLRGEASQGLRISDNAIIGSPSRDGDFMVTVVATDAIGRTVVDDGYFWVQYPTPFTESVADGAGADTLGHKVGAPSIDGAGGLVAFASGLDLTPADANSLPDVYLRNVGTGDLTLISRSPGGSATGDSTEPQLSSDGSTIVFTTSSTAYNGTSGPSVVSYDIRSGQSAVVSAGSSPQVSADGQLISFETNACCEVVVFDRDAGRTAASFRDPRLIRGSTRLSGDGSSLVYATWTDAVAEDADGTSDVFIRRLATFDQPQLVSADLSGPIAAGSFSGPSISDDGSVVSFSSGDMVYRKMIAAASTGVNHGPLTVMDAARSRATVLSGDGSVLAYDVAYFTSSGDTIGYLFDWNDPWHRRSVYDSRFGDYPMQGRLAWSPDLSSDGRHVAFLSVPLNGPVDIVVADMLVR